jgi:transglutaminase-like putative cysteine protease
MVFLFALCLQVQTVVAPEPQGPQEPSPAAVERIRDAVGRPGVVLDKDPDARVFRVYIRERLPPPERVWTDETLRPWYVRTRAPAYHHSFLESVAPEEFRAGTLYPIGVDLLPLAKALINAIRKDMRARAEADARQAVKEELRLLLEAREKAGVDR